MKKRKGEAAQTNNFEFRTSREIDALEQGASNGRFINLWESDIDPATGKPRLLYKTSSHSVSLRADAVATLEQFIMQQDADFAFAMLYVLGALLPPQPLPSNLRAGDWIDLSDVMEKIGWNMRRCSIAERNEKRLQLYRYLVFGHEATVNGRRSERIYTDPQTGEQVSTHVDSPIWRINREEHEIIEETGQMIMQEAVKTDYRAPRRVEIIITKEWEPLLTGSLAQYLPAAQSLTAIPSNQVSGDWARGIGLCLARLWRSYPRETLNGKLTLSRADLLTHYTPKTRTVDEILSSKNPRRAATYWRDAMRFLVKAELIADSHEAARTVEEMLERFEGYNWHNAWLEEIVEILPGPLLIESIKERAGKVLDKEKPRKSKKRR